MTSYDYARQPKVTLPGCPVCGITSKKYARTDRWGFKVGICHCPCGLVYLNPRMTAAAYTEFYRDWYRPLVSLWDKRPVNYARLEAAQRAYGAVIGRVWPELDKRAVLDAGGCTGAALEGFGVLPSAGTVLEPDQVALSYARAKGYQTLCGLIEDPDWRDLVGEHRFQTLLCLRTSDHLLDPLAAFKALASVAEVTGTLIVDYCRDPLTPRFTCEARGVEIYQNAPKIDHPLYWTKASLAKALQLSGWTVVEKKFWDHKGVLRCQKS